MLVWLFLWRHALGHIIFLLISAHMSIAYIIRYRGMILSVVLCSIMQYRTWLIQGWSTCLGQVWPPILCLHILHMQSPLLLVFNRLIWMLMVLTVVWYFDISWVEDLVKSTWVYHFVVVQLRALLILIMVVIGVICILLSLVWFRVVVYNPCWESSCL